MKTKPRRDHDADAAMLAYRTGLNAALCKAWLEAQTAKSIEAIEAALMADSGGSTILAARSEIEAFALARLKTESTWTVFQRPERLRPQAVPASLLRPRIRVSSGPSTKERGKRRA
jgi:hypothetical protein